eukprot:729106-Alexandrium_andersonii.AAC.1
MCIRDSRPEHAPLAAPGARTPARAGCLLSCLAVVPARSARECPASRRPDLERPSRGDQASSLAMQAR